MNRKEREARTEAHDLTAGIARPPINKGFLSFFDQTDGAVSPEPHVDLVDVLKVLTPFLAYPLQ